MSDAERLQRMTAFWATPAQSREQLGSVTVPGRCSVIIPLRLRWAWPGGPASPAPAPSR